VRQGKMPQGKRLSSSASVEKKIQKGQGRFKEKIFDEGKKRARGSEKRGAGGACKKRELVACASKSGARVANGRTISEFGRMGCKTEETREKEWDGRGTDQPRRNIGGGQRRRKT